MVIAGPCLLEIFRQFIDGPFLPAGGARTFPSGFVFDEQ